MPGDPTISEELDTAPQQTSRIPSSGFDDSLDALLPIKSFLKEHPAIIGILLYFQVSAVGIVYIWKLL